MSRDSSLGNCSQDYEREAHVNCYENLGSPKENQEISKEKFKKFDSGKVDLTLVPSCHSKHYACIAMMGEKKYGRNNWKQATVNDVIRYYSAMLRHQTSELEGEFNDPESGMPHGWHALWNRTAVNYFVDKFGYDEVIKSMNGDDIK